MSIITSIAIKIFFLLLVGYMLAKFHIVNENAKQSMSNMLIYVFLPANLLLSSQDEFSYSHMVGIGYTTIIATVFYIIVMSLCFFLGKLFLPNRDKSGIFTLLIAFANTGFIGMSIISETVPGAGLLYGAIYNCVFDIIYFSVGLLLLKSNSSSFSIKEILNNPIIWVSIASIILYIIPYRICDIFMEPVDILAKCMLPISMIIIGAELYTVSIKEILSDKLAYFTSFIKMILLPLIVFGIMYILKVDREVAMTVVILTAMPSGTLNVIMSRKYDKYPEYATITIMQNTLLMIVTLPCFIYLCQFL